jgi:hypothetical protein
MLLHLVYLFIYLQIEWHNTTLHAPIHISNVTYTYCMADLNEHAYALANKISTNNTHWFVVQTIF